MLKVTIRPFYLEYDSLRVKYGKNTTIRASNMVIILEYDSQIGPNLENTAVLDDNTSFTMIFLWRYSSIFDTLHGTMVDTMCVLYVYSHNAWCRTAPYLTGSCMCYVMMMCTGRIVYIRHDRYVCNMMQRHDDVRYGVYDVVWCNVQYDDGTILV